ncbi:c-type cytochrome [Marinibactrum halimedae]|uniref:Cytochrome c domain-containing protein n=1 Tax=Marinibactrum halimedae TaxID=1444977 RepID=A0AA37WNK4_9GAMM|nr:hypothetical protein [Marinibactrum halimedae]MCD9460973.1 hypothetical protein [Marinibactrum halimedae]GLS28084.1 hypothetical protein GCM10007877_38030 [Marinibactrum halimedae]
MGFLKSFLLAGSTILATSASMAEPVSMEDAKAMAAVCNGCHGPLLSSPLSPPLLHNQPADQLFTKLITYKTGQLEGTLMNRIAKGYSKEQLRAIANVLASTTSPSSTP